MTHRVLSAKKITNRINETREPETQYEQNQQVFIRNPAAARQKLAPRFYPDKVTDNLPIHIYTSKNRGPVAKNRLKRTLKNNNSRLLQVPNSNLDRCGSNSRDPT